MSSASEQSDETLTAPRAFSRPLELALYAASPAATLLTAPLLARALGPEARGQYGVAMAVVGFALTISAWGQGETLLKEARHGRSNLRTQSRLTLIGGGIATVIAAIAMIPLGVPIPLAIAAAALIPVLNQAVVWRAWAVSRRELRLPAIYNALSAVLRVAVLLGVAAFGALDGLSAMIVTQVTLALMATVTIGRYARSSFASSSGSSASIGNLLRTGGAVILFDAFNAVTIRSDLIILPLTVSAHEVGLYAAPASLTTAALAVSLPFKSRAQAIAISGPQPVRLVRELGILLGLGAAGIIAAFALAGPVVSVAFGSQYDGSIPILRLLAIATVGLVACDVAQGVLVVLSIQRDLIIVGALSAAIVGGSLLLLCPLLGGVGAAIALIIGYSVSAALGWAFVIVRARQHVRKVGV